MLPSVDCLFLIATTLMKMKRSRDPIRDIAFVGDKFCFTITAVKMFLSIFSFFTVCLNYLLCRNWCFFLIYKEIKRLSIKKTVL